MANGAEERTYTGTPVTGGVVIGPLHFLPEIPESATATVSLDDALAVAAAQLENLIDVSDDEAADILAFQIALLEDDDLLDPVREEMARGVSPDQAWQGVMNQEIVEYRLGGDPVFAARADDLVDLRDRVLQALFGASGALDVPDGSIVIAKDLTPSVFLGLDWTRLAGAATSGGSPTSHVAILARARGVPLMVGAEPVDAADGDAVLDLRTGRLIVRPNAGTLSDARNAAAWANAEAVANAEASINPGVTADGTPIDVLINVDAPEILEDLDAGFCDGVGLTRTEFLFHDGPPGEDAQLAFYRRLLDWAGGRPVTIRTLDAGGDKPLPGITVDGEVNPFLGVRGVRLSLANPSLFRVQLRALMRAAADGPLKIMVPMVTASWELEAVRDLLHGEYDALRRDGIDCAVPPLGIMVEVPSAALTAREFDADFYSIGSNDLVQYTTASARDNAAVSHLADPSSAAVLQLIAMTVAAGRDRGVPVSLCGDMASSPECAADLLAQGLRTFSCAPAQIGPVKRALAAIRIGGAA